MRVKVLASGSKGNSTYLETEEVKLLIDIGISFPYLRDNLEKIGVDPKELDGILITHSHSDHIKGLQSLVKRTNINVYIPEKMKPDIEEKIPEENIHLLSPEVKLKDITVESIKTSHDVESVGYILSDDKSSMVYITDTGYINRRYLSKLSNKDLYIIESNHDEKMLMDGPYPYILKQRILSDKGHLSNMAVAEYLQEIVGNKTKYIVLAHLSEHNNTEELAYNTTKCALEEKNKEKEILIAKPNESLEMIEV